MITQIVVDHVRLDTSRPFEDVVEDFQNQVGTLEGDGWSSVRGAATDFADLERLLTPRLGPSEFTRFLTIDHGAWLALAGRPAKLIMYTLGNPLIAITMLRHDIEAGLDVPVRLAIYETDEGTTRLTYNTPSSLMGALDDPELQAAARVLDAKLLALAEKVTGATP